MVVFPGTRWCDRKVSNTSKYCGNLIKRNTTASREILDNLVQIFAGSLEAAYSLNWGAREIWGKGGGETLALL